jgi:trehalose-6-phosphate synthase
MHAALGMSLEERQDRWGSLHKKVIATTAARFCSVFLGHLGGSAAKTMRPALRAIP